MYLIKLINDILENNKAKEEILKVANNAKIDIIKLDLSDFNSIENFNKELK